jgi:uncharacterized membrane protein YiaA
MGFMKRIMTKSVTAFGALTFSLFFSAATQEIKELRVYLPILIVSIFGLMEYDRQYRESLER